MSWFTRNKKDRAEQDSDTAGTRRRGKGRQMLYSRRHILRRMIIFSMLGTMMFCTKLALEPLPNIHMLGMLTMTYTVVYRYRAMIPIYLCMVLIGLFWGFNPWWIPYLYIWTVLWGVTMLLPRRMPAALAAIVYPIICGLHGLSYGTLYAPAQALMYGYSFEQMLAWIVSGFPFDVVHAAGNLGMGLLVLPLSKLLIKLEKTTEKIR